MKYPFILLAAVLLTACATPKKATVASSPGQLVIDGKIWSSAFQQRAAEYKALCLQAFNIARFRADQAVRSPNQGTGKPRAVVTDIDETFLDNSPYAVHQALQGKDYEAATWYEWTGKGIADTLPGALSFFTYAASLGIEIFYITNRDEKDRAGTLSNLQRFHFPFADNQHLIVRQTTSSKEDRRRQVAATHDIILLLGDNLGDFSALFDKKTEAEREQNVYGVAGEFGQKFIVLPNANYGGWEDAIYQNSHNWTLAQKDSLIKEGLKNY
jgi:5'-nucleotidase (lipoprotein e(P4) family)